ncbi:hypothetical protein [Paucibacter soli]|uniref:hypothetical protein n=1 Tax=Paucibacter soli TaxID=3133433 RepID=UPI0030A3F179
MSSLAHPRPAAWFAGDRRPTRLQQCLTLALLLHVWLVLLVGNTPGGSARPGEGVWGRLNVSLDLGGTPGETGSSPQAAPRPNVGAVGEARRERFGGAVRSEAEAAAAPEQPGAAKLGMWQAQPAELQRERSERLPPLPQARLAELPSVATEPPEAPAPVLKSTAVPAPALTRATRGALVPAASPGQAAEALPRFEPPKLPEAAPLVTKATPELAPQLSRLQPAGAELPPASPVRSAESLPSFEAPELKTPSRVTKTNPDAAPQLTRPDPAALTEALRPQSSAVASGAVPRFEAPSLPMAGAGVGAPDAGARLGQDVATAPSTPASAPKLDLEWRRPRGGEISRQGSRGVLELLAHPPERKSKLSESLENAAKKDCREAYSGAGVLAAVPLLLDAARDKGCRW